MSDCVDPTIRELLENFYRTPGEATHARYNLILDHLILDHCNVCSSCSDLLEELEGMSLRAEEGNFPSGTPEKIKPFSQVFEELCKSRERKRKRSGISTSCPNGDDLFTDDGNQNVQLHREHCPNCRRDYSDWQDLKARHPGVEQVREAMSKAIRKLIDEEENKRGGNKS